MLIIYQKLLRLICMFNIFKRENNNLFLFFILLLFGLFIRIYLVKMPGTFDLGFYANFLAAIDEFSNLSFLYFPGLINIENFKDFNLPVMFPPGFAYILYFFTKLNNLFFQFDYSTLFKTILIFFDLLILSILLYYLRDKFREIIFFFWVNPLMIVCGSALGYMDYMPFFFLLISILLLQNQKFTLAAIFYIISCSVKPLGLIVLPIYFFYYLKKNKIIFNIKLSFLLILLILIGLMPILLSSINFTIIETSIGFFKNMYWGLLTDYISGNGLNFWWIYAGIIELSNNWSIDKSLIENIFEIKFRYLKTKSGIWSTPQFIGRILVIIFTIINIIKVSTSSDKNIFLKAIIFQYFAYCMLATGVHENHSILLGGLASILIFIDYKKYFNFCAIINLYALSNLILFFGINGSYNIRDFPGWSLTTLMPTIFITLYFFFNYKKYLKDEF